MSDPNFLSDLFRATNVKRYHTFPIIGEQTVGHHSCRVALLVLYLTDGRAGANLLKAALFHDLAEISTGDMPATVKWSNPQLSELLSQIEHRFEMEHEIAVSLSAHEKNLLKTADMTELVLFAEEQIRMGNREALRLWHRGILYTQQIGTFDLIKELINESYMAECC